MSFYGGKDGGHPPPQQQQQQQQQFHPDPRLRQGQNLAMYGGYRSGVPMPPYLGGPQDPNVHGGGQPPLMGSYNEYNHNLMNPPAPSPYAPEYFVGNQNYQPQQGQDSLSSGPRPHINPTFLPGEKAEPTKILRNPYPATSTQEEVKGQRKEDVYDPSCPTLSGSAMMSYPVQDFNYANMSYQQQHHPQAHHNPSGGMGMVPPEQGPMPIMHQHQQHPAYHPPSTPVQMDPRQMPSYNTNNSVPSVHQTAAAPYQDNSNGSGNQVRNENATTVKIMAGLVTQIQPGGFGMISEEIFFQQSAVSGSMPKVGDKVVVEAEPVNGMPFKYNAKRVTKLDMDLVNEEKSTASSAPRNTEMGLAPLPALPDSLNLPKPSPPAPLKSILKRNPPPPPVISKSGASAKASMNGPSASSFKSSAFSVDLNRDIPRVLPPSGGPAIEFPEYNYVRVNIPEIPVRLPKMTSPKVTRLLPESPIPQYNGRRASPDRRAPPLSPTMQEILDMNAYSRRSQVEQHALTAKGYSRRSRSPSPRATKPSRKSSRSRSPSPRSKKSRKSSRSRSPSPRSKKSRKYSRSRSISPRSRVSRRKSRSKSPYKGRRNRSRSYSPRKSKRNRSRSRSLTPKRRSRSRTPDRHRKSKSPSRRSHHISSRSRSRDRKKSRSPTLERYRRGSRSERPSRSVSRDRKSRSHSPGNHRHRSRERGSDKHGSKSNRSPNWRKRSSSSSLRSISPERPTGLKIHSEAITHGIVYQKVVSDLFPKIVNRNIEPGPTASENFRAKELPKSTPVPIKFQISNPSKPLPTSTTLVPNPSFTSGPQTTPSYFNSSIMNITKTVVNPSAAAPPRQNTTDSKLKAKKKEQEPAFRIIDDDEINTTNRDKGPVEHILRQPHGSTLTDDKIKQWEVERQVLRNTTGKTTIDTPTPSSSDKLLKDPVNILQLKQTIQNDLNELRQKGQNDLGKKLLENPVNIEQLKQSVQRDLSEFKNKNNEAASSSGNTVGIKASVSEGLKQLRSRFDSENKSKDPPSTVPSDSKQNEAPSASTSKTGNTSTTSQAQAKDKNSNERAPMKYNKSKPTPGRNNPSDEIDLPPYDEDLERMQEEIHQQRFMEEQNRLRSVGDEIGLQQLFYMEDRRRRRLDERNLARLRLREIQLKKEKNFSELQRLRSEWGPSGQRFEQERMLREARKEEERQQSRVGGQAQAIRMHEMEYQQWLEEEAAARLRDLQQNGRQNRGFENEHSSRGFDSDRSSRGFEGRVLRRRTPSPDSRQHGNRGERSGSHDRHNQSDDWDPRGPPPPHPMGFGPPPDHPDFFDGPPPPGYFDERARMEEEMMNREMEFQQRMEMDGRFPGPPHHSQGPPPPHRGDYTRFVVPRH